MKPCPVCPHEYADTHKYPVTWPRVKVSNRV